MQQTNHQSIQANQSNIIHWLWWWQPNMLLWLCSLWTLPRYHHWFLPKPSFLWLLWAHFLLIGSPKTKRKKERKRGKERAQRATQSQQQCQMKQPCQPQQQQPTIESQWPKWILIGRCCNGFGIDACGSYWSDWCYQFSIWRMVTPTMMT